MKKRKIWILIAAFLVIIALIGIFFLRQEKENPIKDKIVSLDPKKITGCHVEWLTMENEYYSYTETDPEKVSAIYEALRHMKFKEVPYDPLFGASYYGIDLVADDKMYAIFSLYDEHVLAPGHARYEAIITNLDKMEEEYGWKTLLREMLGKAAALKDVSIVKDKSFLVNYEVAEGKFQVQYHITLHNPREEEQSVQICGFFPNDTEKYSEDELLWACNTEGETVTYTITGNATEELNVVLVGRRANEIPSEDILSLEIAIMQVSAA